jgi:formylglycine-generating enzyme required for sulfatase activity
MVLIPAGEFLMGSDPARDKDAYDSEQPLHTLYLPDYYIARTPVTYAQYGAFLQASWSKLPEHWPDLAHFRAIEDHPVVYVNWPWAAAYCDWLAEVTGRPYGLPSEAEWEKGARGTNGRIYPWGDEWDSKRCWIAEQGMVGTKPVGTYPQGASPYGLLDMVGNVWEWTRSLHWDYPYDPEDGREDLDATPETGRVTRGGSWGASHRTTRCAARACVISFKQHSNVGFRVLLSPALLSIDS